MTNTSIGPERLAQSSLDRAAIASIAVLGISNLATNRWLPEVAYVPWNLAMTAGLVGLARWSGCTTDELGADPRHLARSVREGAAGAGMVAAGYGLLLPTPAGADVFRDERATSVTRMTALSHLLMRIPLGTVLTEEVAFRGVLPALLKSPRRPAWVPGVVASLLFGLWHVLPSLELSRANLGIRRVVGATGSGRAVALAVGVTTVGGGVLHCLRQRTGHLAAPVAVHLATNFLGFLGARLTGRNRWRRPALGGHSCSRPWRVEFDESTDDEIPSPGGRHPDAPTAQP